jgi:hypothetical protein
VHGFGPAALADLWNPYVALLPFTLAGFLAWDAALGRPRALVEAVLPATFAVQSHLAYLSLVALLAVWLVAWVRWSPRYVGDTSPGGPKHGDHGHGDHRDAGHGPPDDEPPDADRPVSVLASLGGARTLRRMGVIAAVLWLGPLLDALFDRHNPLHIAGSLIDSNDVVGPVDGTALVGYYIGPFGRWALGSTDSLGLTVSRAYALMVVAVLVLLAACLRAARRRHLGDAVALTSLAVVLVVGGVVAGARLVVPTPPYLLQWMKVIGGFVWFAVGWTGWRLLDAQTGRRRLAAAVAGVALVGGVAWSWGSAFDNAPPHDERPELVADIRSALRAELDDDLTYRVEVVGDPMGHHHGIIYWMIRDGHDVVTADGSAGLKWGRRHVWDRGDDVDAHITVAVHYGNSLSPSFDECSRDPGQGLLFSHSDLGRDDLTFIEDVNLRRVGEQDVSARDEARWEELADRDFRVAVFEGDDTCGDEDTLGAS